MGLFDKSLKRTGKTRRTDGIMFLFFVAAFLVFLVHAGKSEHCVLAGNTDPLELVSTIVLENDPTGIVVNEKTNLVYVSTKEGLVVIDGGTDKIVEEIPLRGGALVLAADPQNNRVYASASSEEDRGCIKVIDGATHSVIGEIPESATAWEFAVNPVTNLIYIADPSITLGLPDCVHVYDGDTFERLTLIEIPGSDEVTTVRSVGVAVNPQTNLVYVAWNYHSSVFAIDGATNEIVRTVSVPPWDIYKVKVNPYTDCVYIEFGSVVLDGTTLGNVTSDYEGSFEAVDPVRNILYTSGYEKLYALDGNSHRVGAVLHAEYLDDVAVNSRTGRVYLTHRDILENEPIREVSVVQGPLSPFHLAEFVVSDLFLEKEEAEVKEYCGVTVKVMNVGDLEDSYTVEFRVDGSVKAKQGVTLLGGESETVEFSFYEEEPGTYEVEVDGQRGIVSVYVPPSYALYVVVVVAVIMAVVLGVLVRRMRSSRKKKAEVKRRAPGPSPVPI